MIYMAEEQGVLESWQLNVVSASLVKEVVVVILEESCELRSWQWRW